MTWLIWHCLQPEKIDGGCHKKSPDVPKIGSPHGRAGEAITHRKNRRKVWEKQEQQQALGMASQKAMTHLTAWLLLANWAVVSGKLIGAAVVPHGDFAYDPKLVNDTGRNVASLLKSLRSWGVMFVWRYLLNMDGTDSTCGFRPESQTAQKSSIWNKQSRGITVGCVPTCPNKLGNTTGNHTEKNNIRETHDVTDISGSKPCRNGTLDDCSRFKCKH